MANAFRILLIINIKLLLIAILSTLVYLIPIICIRRFHTATNILTINVCLSAIICSSYWIISNVMYGFYSIVIVRSTFTCIFIFYMQVIVDCLLVYSFAIITFNRYLVITYPNQRFFKRHAWYFVTTSVQWILVIIFSIPNLIFSVQRCVHNKPSPQWLDIYTFIIIIILPIISNVIFNSLILYSVRSSTRRIRALTITMTITNLSGKPNHQNSRDIRLLKHMLFVFIIFIIGWAPIYIVQILNLDDAADSILQQILQTLAVLSAIIIVLDLFYYNHDLRQYLKQKFLKVFNLN